MWLNILLSIFINYFVSHLLFGLYMMDFKHLTNDKTQTPKSKSLVNRVFTCDSPIVGLPRYSTPPSKFAQIRNPFDCYLIDRIHLPTFSPSVFAQQAQTPDRKIRWTIDDISKMRQADIDETTIDQHVFESDPTVELLVQEKINRYFSDKVIVPSPISNHVTPPIALIQESPTDGSSKKQYCDGSTQTMLSLPAILPPHVEEVLKPYLNCIPLIQDMPFGMTKKDLSIYRNLFRSPTSNDSVSSADSSPDLSSDGLSPSQLRIELQHDCSLDTNVPNLHDCSLSPIGSNRKKMLSEVSFAAKMSIDGVPDGENSSSCHSQSSFIDNEVRCNSSKDGDVVNISPMNWDVEYKSIFMNSPSSGERMELSNVDTPHTKAFSSQRKRLSDSFHNGDDENKTSRMDDYFDSRRLKYKISRDDMTDTGYQTGGATICDTLMFASTPKTVI